MCVKWNYRKAGIIDTRRRYKKWYAMTSKRQGEHELSGEFRVDNGRGRSRVVGVAIPLPWMTPDRVEELATAGRRCCSSKSPAEGVYGVVLTGNLLCLIVCISGYVLRRIVLSVGWPGEPARKIQELQRIHCCCRDVTSLGNYEGLYGRRNCYRYS